MKWFASVAALSTILFLAASPRDAIADSRVLVSQNETDVDLDSPDLFPTKNAVVKPVDVPPTKPAAPTRAPASVKKSPKREVALDDIDLDEDTPAPKKKATPKKSSTRKPASLDDVELDEDDDVEAPPSDAVLVKPKTIVTKSLPEDVIETPATAGAAKSSDPVEAAVDEALVLEEKKDYKKMLSLLQPYADRLSRRGLLTLARAAKGAGDKGVELKTLQLCLAKNPNDYVIQTQLGEVYSRSKKSADAVAAFQAAIAINKRFEPAYDGLWQELERAKEYYEARSVLSDMMKLFGEKPKFYSALCRLYSFDDYLDKATEMCRTAIKMDPKHPDNYVHLGVSLRDQEGADEARKVLQGAANRFPASEPVQTTTGSLYLDKKDFAIAYRYYKQATKADPKSTRAWQGLGNTAFELQKNDEALDAFGKACAIDRKMTKDLRAAIAKLRARKDTRWEMRYEARLLKCE